MNSSRCIAPSVCVPCRCVCAAKRGYGADAAIRSSTACTFRSPMSMAGPRSSSWLSPSTTRHIAVIPTSWESDSIRPCGETRCCDAAAALRFCAFNRRARWSSGSLRILKTLQHVCCDRADGLDVVTAFESEHRGQFGVLDDRAHVEIIDLLQGEARDRIALVGVEPERNEQH